MAKRGRPKGSGGDYTSALMMMAGAICRRQVKSVREAVRRVAQTHPEVISCGERTLRRRYEKDRLRLEEKAMNILITWGDSGRSRVYQVTTGYDEIQLREWRTELLAEIREHLFGLSPDSPPMEELRRLERKRHAPIRRWFLDELEAFKEWLRESGEPTSTDLIF